MDPLFFRGAERLLVDIGGIASITFGFLLFKKSIIENGELVAKHGSAELTLRNVGPGVLFAAFGMAILIGSLLSPIEIRVGASNKEAQGHAEGISEGTSYIWGQGQKQPEDWKSSYEKGFYNLNKAIMFLDSPPKDQKEREEAQIVSRNIAKFRHDLAIIIFGEEAFEQYIKTRTDANLLGTLPKDKRKIIDEISTLLTQQ